ncbi:MAG TPA: patatin-like phospholipase family protein [Xanthobacteraceae bacterium]|nr:patatin-like phospholipase family protein [Xanthobacteraceae bacterium]
MTKAPRESHRHAPASKQKKTFALALGGGGARGIAHVAVLEALDEMGVKPAAIAGSSIGAAIGAAYAAGMTGKAIRHHLVRIAHRRPETLSKLITARATTLSQLFSAGFGNPMVLDAEKLCAAFLPPDIPGEFEGLSIPLIVMTTDLHGRKEVPFSSGPLASALAASLAVPGLLQPVSIGGRLFVDGAAVNPLPFDHLRGRADIIVAVDSSIGPAKEQTLPDPWECLFMTLQVMGHTIISEKLKHGAPDLVIRPNVGIFRMLDFFQASAILRVADAVKAEVREQLKTRLELK